MMTELENHPWLAVILSEIDDPTLPVDDENPLIYYGHYSTQKNRKIFC